MIRLLLIRSGNRQNYSELRDPIPVLCKDNGMSIFGVFSELEELINGESLVEDSKEGHRRFFKARKCCRWCGIQAMATAAVVFGR